MFQGSKTEKERNYRPFPFRPETIRAVMLSHAHIDHCGLLPKLVRHGLAGSIHATPATTDLAGVMLPDNAHVQQGEVEQFNHRALHRRAGKVHPIYDAGDVNVCLARFWNADHLLGSAPIELELTQADGRGLRLLFSGDMGPDHKLMQPDPQKPAGIDYLICEAICGDVDRADADAAQRRILLRDEVQAVMQAGGALLIPFFAVERAQELISDMERLIAERELPGIPIYVDSPLATRAKALCQASSRA